MFRLSALPTQSRPAVTMIGAAALLLAGCASVSREDCVSADWRTIGYVDGLNGAPAAQIGVHRSACAKFQVIPDLAAYTEGRERGLKEYCQPKNGFRAGVNGWTYANVCPAAVEPAFVDGYRYGRQLHDARGELHGAQARLRGAEKNLAQNAAAVDSVTAELIQADVPAARRAYLAQELVRLAQERRDLQDRIGELSLHTRDLVASVKDLELRSPYGY